MKQEHACTHPLLLVVDCAVRAEAAVLDNAELVLHLGGAATGVVHLAPGLHISIVPSLCLARAGEGGLGHSRQDWVVLNKASSHPIKNLATTKILGHHNTKKCLTGAYQARISWNRHSQHLDAHFLLIITLPGAAVPGRR